MARFNVLGLVWWKARRLFIGIIPLGSQLEAVC